MQTKCILLAACLLTTVFLQASPSLPPRNHLSKPAQADVKCNLPAPNNFHLVDLGTNMAKVAWDIQPDALGGYRIRTYRSSDSVLVSTILKPQDVVEATITGLDSGEEYFCIINGCCAGGGHSEIHGKVTFIVLILDLVVVGYTGDHGALDCTIVPTGGTCSFPITGGHFKIYANDNGPAKNFDLYKMPGSLPRYRCEIGTNLSYRPLYFSCPGPSGSVPPTCESHFLDVSNHNGFQVAFFTVAENFNGVTLTPRLECTLAQGYTIESYLPALHKQHSPERSVNTPSPTISPNPFSESLDISPAQPSTENITLQLYNLSGQKVLDQQFPGGQGQYSLPTAGLSPGFYMLRIEADGAVQTLKVIKSE